MDRGKRQPPRPDDRSGCEFLLVDDVAIQECHDLCARAGILRAEFRRAHTVRNAVLHGPQNGAAVIRASAHVGKRIARAGRRGLALVAPEERDDLRTGAGIVRAKLCRAHTIRDAVLDSPQNGLVIVLPSLDVGKWVGTARRLRLPGRAPQECHDLRTCATLLGTERRGRGAVRNAAADRPVDRIMRPVSAHRHVREDAAGAVGAVAGLITRLHRFTRPIQSDKCIFC